MRRAACPIAGFVLLLCCGGAAAASPPEAGSGFVEAAEDRGEPRLEARLLLHPDDGSGHGSLRAGVLFEPDPGWHLYWKNPGETGLPTRVDWRIDGGTAGELAWPAPRVFHEEGLVTYGYAEPVLLASELSLSPGASRRLAADVEVLVCRERCIPARFTLERPLDGPAGDDVDAVRALFADAAARVPRPPQELGLEVEALYDRSGIRPGDPFAAGLAVHCVGGPADCPGARPAPGPDAFVPGRLPDVELTLEGTAPHPLAETRGFVLRLAGQALPGAPETPARLTGVLGLVAPDGARLPVALDLPLPLAPAGTAVGARELPWSSTGDAATAQATPGGGALLGLLGLALLGGVILNLMPCVLPVLAIKVFAVAELAHRDRREVLRQGFAYAAGIEASMLVLAGGVTALRAVGTSVGWGFQFQEPLFLAAVSAVVLLFALNLLGVFEIGLDTGRLAGVGADAVGSRRSFFEGLLAVVLATPCSAPFLGTAVGFAFAGSPALIFGVFLAIGLGLAAPFLLVTLVPGWARIVPRSGPWMLHVRALLGFALLATVVWLLWILGRVAGASGMVGVLGLLWGLALLAWACGRLQQAGSPGLGRALAAVAALVLLLGANTVSLRPEAQEAGDVLLEGEVYDRDRVAERLSRGQPAFVYFTADWCLTCKVNERLVLRSPRVQAAFAERGVAVFRADWTQRDDAIRRELERFGRAGVPLYVWYSGEPGAEPELLPELLRPELVLAALEGADDPSHR